MHDKTGGPTFTAALNHARALASFDSLCIMAVPAPFCWDDPVYLSERLCLCNPAISKLQAIAVAHAVHNLCKNDPVRSRPSATTYRAALRNIQSRCIA